MIIQLTPFGNGSKIAILVNTLRLFSLEEINSRPNIADIKHAFGARHKCLSPVERGELTYLMVGIQS